MALSYSTRDFHRAFMGLHAFAIITTVAVAGVVITLHALAIRYHRREEQQ